MKNNLTYIPGKTYGPYNLLLLKRSDRKDKKTGKFKYGWYACLDCGKPFEARNYNVKIGDAIRCPECRTIWKKKTSIFNTLNKKYEPGMEVGPNNILFIEELEHTKQNTRTGFFKCPVCGRENWHTRLSDICSGASSKCPECCTKENIVRCSKNGDESALDLVGKHFGELTVIRRADFEKHSLGRLWYCECSCGGHREAHSKELSQGRIWHCGCLSPKSKGERKISQILEHNNLSFEREYKFDDCINPLTKAILRFDFYLPNYNLCIEYDGIQHFEETSWRHESLKDVQYRDSIKNNYCKEHNIQLIRIPYWDFDKLNDEYLLSLINN